MRPLIRAALNAQGPQVADDVIDRVDVPIHLYSLYSHPNPEFNQKWASRDEVLAYWVRVQPQSTRRPGTAAHRRLLLQLSQPAETDSRSAPTSRQVCLPFGIRLVTLGQHCPAAHDRVAQYEGEGNLYGRRRRPNFGDRRTELAETTQRPRARYVQRSAVAFVPLAERCRLARKEGGRRRKRVVRDSNHPQHRGNRRPPVVQLVGSSPPLLSNLVLTVLGSSPIQHPLAGLLPTQGELRIQRCDEVRIQTYPPRTPALSLVDLPGIVSSSRPDLDKKILTDPPCSDWGLVLQGTGKYGTSLREQRTKVRGEPLCLLARFALTPLPHVSGTCEVHEGAAAREVLG